MLMVAIFNNAWIWHIDKASHSLSCKSYKEKFGITTETRNNNNKIVYQDFLIKLQMSAAPHRNTGSGLHSIRAAGLISEVSLTVEDQRCSSGLTAGCYQCGSSLTRLLFSHHRDSKAVQKKTHAFDRAAPSLTGSQTWVILTPMPTSLCRKKKNLKRAFPASQEGTFRNTLAFFFFFACVCVSACCQIGGACRVFTGTQGWAVVLAVSGRPTDWQPARLSLEDSYWGGVAEWTIRDCDVH